MGHKELASWGSLEKLAHLESYKAVRFLSYLLAMEVPISVSRDYAALYVQPICQLNIIYAAEFRDGDEREFRVFCQCVGKGDFRVYLKYVCMKWTEGKILGMSFHSWDVLEGEFLRKIELCGKDKKASEVKEINQGSRRSNEAILKDMRERVVGEEV